MASAGGTFALYSLICRFAGMRPANNGIPDASDVTLSHYRSAQLLLDCSLWLNILITTPQSRDAQLPAADPSHIVHL